MLIGWPRPARTGPPTANDSDDMGTRTHLAHLHPRQSIASAHLGQTPDVRIDYYSIDRGRVNGCVRACVCKSLNARRNETETAPNASVRFNLLCNLN